MNIYKLAELGIIPIPIIEIGIDYLLKNKLQIEMPDSQTNLQEKTNRFIEELKSMPIAVATELANQQHYEIPSDFFKLVLGKNLKYSSCLWLNENDNLDTAETNMLDLYCQKAKIIDGQNILELGCGWGSLTLYLSSKYPNCNITAISNSHSQRRFIEEKIKSKKTYQRKNNNS